MTSSTAFRVDRANAFAWAGIASIAAYFAVLMHGVRTWPYSEWMVLLLLPVLTAVGVVVIVRVTRDDEHPLTGLIVVAMVVKLAASFVRYYVVFSLYGTGDAARYDGAANDIVNAFHRRETSLTDLLTLRQGSWFVEDLTAVVYAVMGSSRLGGFVVYSFVGFWGLFLFHRAALIGLPEGSQRRYALLVFFLPSLVFWPSSIGKEAVMMLSLGMCAWGTARVLEHKRGGGWIALAAGAGLGYMVRPHVPVVVLAALAVTILFRRRRGRPAVLGPIGRIVTAFLLMAAMAFMLGRTIDRFIPKSEATTTAGQVGQLLDLAATGTDEGGSEIDRPSPNSPLEYPQAAFTVLFRPTILDAQSARSAVAAAETTLVVVLGIASWRRIANVPLVALRRPYVMFCIIYSGIFAFAWSSFSNLGALARQRVQVWPFVLLLLAVPAVGTGGPRANRSRRRRELMHQSDADVDVPTNMARPASPRVLIVTASACRRGAELQATQLTAELRRRDVPVVALALTGAGGGVALPLPVLGRRRLGPRTLWRLRRAARNADVVIAYGSTTLPACVIALAGSSRPFVYRNISDPGYWVRNRLHQAVTGFQYRRASLVVALWRGAGDSVARLYGVRADRVIVIPNARDPAVFRPPTAGQRDHARGVLGLAAQPVIGFVGRLSVEKRIDVAISAVAALPDHVLVVAGDGPLRADAERQAEAEAPGRVWFLGEVDDVIPVLHAVDVLVITSGAEGMPGVAIEAMLCGVPVVATDVGAVSEVVGSSGVVLSARATAGDVVEAVRSVAATDGRLSADARRRAVKTLSWDVVAPQWCELLTRIAGPRPAGGTTVYCRD